MEVYLNYNPNIDIIVVVCGAVVICSYAAIASFLENRKG